MLTVQIDTSQLSEVIQNAVRSALIEIPTQKNTDADEFLDIHQASEFLKLSISTIYLLVSKGEIPNNKKGKRLYFLKSELSTWIKSGRKKTNSEIREQAKVYLVNKKRLNNGK